MWKLPRGCRGDLPVLPELEDFSCRERLVRLFSLKSQRLRGGNRSLYNYRRGDCQNLFSPKWKCPTQEGRAVRCEGWRS